MRFTVAAAVSLALVSIGAAQQTRAALRAPTNIPGQSLASALQTLANDRDIQVIFVHEELVGRDTAGATGQLTADEALTKLLAGTGLSYKYIDEKTITVFPPPSAAQPQSTPATPKAEEVQKSSGFWDRFRVAQVAAANAVSTTAPADAAAAETKVEEVIVSAQKRAERLQDVPVPVTAIEASALVTSNQLRMQDYYTSVPGLNVTSAGFHNAPMLSIRGITTGSGGGFANPTVGIVVDDVPYGSSTGNGGGIEAPDIDPSDLSRIEVLRGPQGTLYGASSIGGLLKLVTIDPSTDAFSGRVQGGVSSVKDGGDAGYNVRGSVNVPISDTFALRASAFTRNDPGYIDNVQTGERDVNSSDTSGGRLSALWRPSESLTVKLSALMQKIAADGSSDVQVAPGFGDLEQDALRGTGGYDKKMQAYSASITAALGSAELTSLTGYSRNRYSDSYDFTPVFSGLTDGQFGVTGTPLEDHNETKRFTQELRLSMPLGDRIDWLVGAYYTHEDSEYEQDVFAAEQDTGVRVGEWFRYHFPSTFEETAAFTDITVKASDRFDIQFGARESRNRQSYSLDVVGLFCPLFWGLPSPCGQNNVHTKDNAFTYLVTPRLKLSPDLMIYGRVASGYRPGGPNQNAVVLGLPPSYEPDKTENYEVGIKGDALDHRLTFDASVYYINWKNIQLQLFTPTSQGYYANAGSARSQGVELSVLARPVSTLTISSALAFNDAQLSDDLPAASNAHGLSGDRLPFSTRFSGSVALDQDIAVSGDVTAFVGATVSYVGDRKGTFQSTAVRQDFPSYTKADLRAGVRYDSWTASLFLNNVADERGLLAGGLGTFNPQGFYYIQPRTIGVILAKAF